MDEKLNPKDKVLLMRDEGEGNKLKVVRGIDKKGKIDAVDPMKAKQTDFLIIDRHADPIENFFKNFVNQAKNPSHTGFYAVTVDMLDKILSLNDKELEKYRINPNDYLNKEQDQSTKETRQESTKEQVTEEKKEEKKETTAEQKTEFKPLDIERIPESEYQKYGIKPENLVDELSAMSYGYKSPHLVDITPNIEGVDYPMKARLSLEEQPGGSLKFIPHPYQQQVDLDKPFQGILLPDDVKENLLATGNAGRIVELEPRPGEKIPSLVSIDKLTNRLEAVSLEKLTVSQNLKGVELTPEQQQALKAGEKVLVKGMISKNTIGTDNPRKFDAFIQFNAAKGGYDFSYEGLDRNKYRQDNKQGQSQEQERKLRIPQRFHGVPISEKQQDALRNNQPIYVKGMVKDGKGEPFNAWIVPNHEKQKFDFFKWKPKIAQVIPAEESKKQVAVNTHGKTDEATKHVKEPLKQGQQKPTENQDKQQKQGRGAKKKKSTGHKM